MDSNNNVSYRDPSSMYMQRELGMSQRQIISKAKRMGLRTRKIYGRIWIESTDAKKMAESTQQGDSTHGQ